MLRGIPWTKLVVPSMGSTIQSQSLLLLLLSLSSMAAALASAPGSTSSSPKKSWSGNCSRTVFRIVSSQRGSMRVRRSRLLALRSVTSAPPAFPRIMSPACLAALVATSRTSASASGERSVSFVSEAADDDDDKDDDDDVGDENSPEDDDPWWSGVSVRPRSLFWKGVPIGPKTRKALDAGSSKVTHTMANTATAAIIDDRKAILVIVIFLGFFRWPRALKGGC
mmetsp:Transcript_26229/g.57460  ORF Transcript_26229/g.57460 Transcript_26229/m.57460 type:complete len:224 (+) Transcript_26229:842-1513(+)